MAKKFKCENCGSKKVFISYTGHGPVLYCDECGEFIQDLNEEELAKATRQVERQKEKV